MPYPSDYLFPGDDLFPSDLDDGGGNGVGTLWAIDDWVGYEGMQPQADDLGCLHFVTSTDGSPAVVGWEGKAAPRVQSDDRPSADGTNDGQSTQPGKTVTIQGITRAPDIATLQQAMGRLSGLLMSGDRYGQLVAVESWMTRQMRARHGAEAIVLPSRTVAREATFSFVFYGPAGRRLGNPMIASTGLPAATGGFDVPLVVPLVINETVVSGICDLTNPGEMTGPVVVRIDGPIVGPVITHIASGQQIVFASSLTLAAGEWLTVDMERHEVLANGQEGASRNQSVLPNGRGWSGFDKGANEWALTAQSGGSAAGMTITAWPAWP